MKKPFAYLMNITKEIEELTVFPYAEEEWAVKAKIEQGTKTYIKLLNNEVVDYLNGNMSNKRVELTDEQKQQIKTALQEAMNKAKARFGSFD